MTSYSDLYVNPQSPLIHSQRFLLEEALHKANNAVLFDRQQYWQDALRVYGDTVSLFNQVIRMSLGEEDRTKLEAIVRLLAHKPQSSLLTLSSGTHMPNAYMSFRTTLHHQCIGSDALEQ